MNIGFTWRAQSTIYRDSIDLLAVRDDGIEFREVLQTLSLEVKRIDRHRAITEPTLALSPASARSLMQALWDAGIRPNNGEGSDAEINALKSHIKYAEGVTGALLQRMKVES